MSAVLTRIARESLEKLRSTIREIGFGNAVLYWIDRCCRRQSDRVRVYRYESSGRTSAITSANRAAVLLMRSNSERSGTCARGFVFAGVR